MARVTMCFGRESSSGIDDAKAEEFLREYAKTGGKIRAARAVGLTYNQVANEENNNAAFAYAVQQAENEFVEALESEAYRRAVEGVDEPIIGGPHKDEVVTHVKRYSDALLQQLLKGRHPKRYRERMSVEQSGSVGHDHRVDVDLSRLSAEQRRHLRALLQPSGEDQTSSGEPPETEDGQ